MLRCEEIQWPTLIGLHYDEFRATASGIFALYKTNFHYSGEIYGKFCI